MKKKAADDKNICTKLGKLTRFRLDKVLKNI